MGMDAAHLAASVAKSLEVERTPSATQRASEISQEQIVDESMAALHIKKAAAPDQLQREKIRQDRERRRRELERRGGASDTDADAENDGGSVLDVVA